MSKNNQQRTKILKDTLQYFKDKNRLTAFPLIDTEHIMILENKIKDDNIDYDMEPVVCCTHCHSLYLITDTEDNDKCVQCNNSINELEFHKTIFHYLNKYPYKE